MYISLLRIDIFILKIEIIFLQIFNASYENGVSLCGNSTNDLDTGCNNVTIEFRSDGSINDRGALVTWNSGKVWLTHIHFCIL